MSEYLASIAQSLSTVGLASLPLAEFETWMAAENTDAVPFLESMAADDSSVAHGLEMLTNGIQGAINDNENAENIWETITSFAPQTCKLLLMIIQAKLLKYASMPPKPRFSEETHEAMHAVSLYFALLRIPGATAHGLLDQSVLRRCISFVKTQTEILALAFPGTQGKHKAVKSTGARPVRSRSARSTGMQVDGDDAAEEADVDGADDEHVADDDDDFGAKKASTQRIRRQKSGAGSKADGKQPFTVPDRVVAVIHQMYFCMMAMVHDTSFKSQTEVLPWLIDAALATIHIPENVDITFEADPILSLSQVFGVVSAGSSLLELGCAVLLCLVSAKHQSPLTTARMICKKLKPLLLQGAATASSIALSFGVSGDEDDAPLSQISGFIMPLLNKPVDSRLVRGRAVKIVQSLVSNSLQGKRVDPPGTPLEQHVLCRLPAIAALLQHVAVAAVSAKAEVRSHCTDVLVHMRGCLPHSLRRAFVRFLVRFGRSSRVQYRHFAVEVAARLLGTVGSGASISNFGELASNVNELRSLMYAEGPIPSAEERAEESAGYGEDVMEYAITEELSAEGGDVSAVESPVARKRKSRPSICMLGQTPMRSVSAPSAMTASKSHKSPFYATGTKTDKKQRRESGSNMSFASDLDSCVDPRPTSIILLDYLIRRVSDKAPAVRTRAVTVLADLWSVSHHEFARTNATLCAALLSSGMSSNASGSEVTVMATPTVSSPLNSTAITVTHTASSSAIVPILLRRMEEDGRPAMKRAVLAALASLGCAAAPTSLTNDLLAQHIKGAQLSMDTPISYDTAVTLYANLLEQAQSADVTTVPAVPSQIIGLFGIESVAARGADSSVLVRKAALATMQSFIEVEPDCPALQQLWMATVLPLVFDAEPTVVAKALESVSAVLFAPLLEWHEGSPSGHSAWSMLQCIAASDDLKTCLVQALHLLIRAHVSLAKTDAFSPQTLLKVLRRAVELKATEDGDGCSLNALRRVSWMLLSILSKQVFDVKGLANLTAVDNGSGYLQNLQRALGEFMSIALATWSSLSDELQHAFSASQIANVTLNDTSSSIQLHFPAETVDDSDVTEDAINCLSVISMLSKKRKSVASVETTVEQLTASLCSFMWSPALVAAAVNACTSLVSLGGDITAVNRWGDAVLSACTSALIKFSSCTSQSDVDKYATGAGNVLFLVGECCAIGLEAASGQGVKDGAVEASGKTTTALTVSNSLVTLVQAMLAPSMVVARDDNVVSLGLPEQVRAHAYITLGKLCLRDAALARKYITVFIRDLASQSSPVSVRNNILFVLGDLCVRYTALVDRYIPNLAACIVDAHPLLRQHAIVLLTQLVVEEYVKLRGPLFYRLVTALADGDEQVRRCAESSVLETLMPKFRTAAAAHFIGFMFVSTGCAHLPAYRHLTSGFEVEGEAAITERLTDYAILSNNRRMHIYKSLIKAMPDDQKLVVYGKLGADILAAVSEGVLALNAAGLTAGMDDDAADMSYSIGSVELLVSDALQLLISQDMRGATQVKSSNKQVSEEEMMEDAAEEAASSAANAARSKLMGKIIRKQVVENVLPICLGLRQFLASAKSSLMHHLLGFIKVLMDDFPEDVKDMLAADRQTAAELEFDLRIWQETRQARSSAAQSTPAARRAIIRSQSGPATSTPARAGVRFADVEGVANATMASPVRRSHSGVTITSPKLKRRAPEPDTAADNTAAMTPHASKTADGVGALADRPALSNPVVMSPHPETPSSAPVWNVNIKEGAEKANTATIDAEDDDENVAPPPAKVARTSSRRRAGSTR